MAYPTSLWNPTRKVDDVDDVLASHVNDMQDEVVALETLVGVAPGVNRIPTGNGTSPLTWNANLTFDGSTLTLVGRMTTTGGVHVGGVSDPGADNLLVDGTLGVTGVATLTAQPILSSLTASKPVFTDASKGLVSTGTMPVDQGGTGLTSYAVGDLLYASGATTIGKLADVAVGQVLTSGGVGAAPAYSASPTVTGVTLSGLTASRLVLTDGSKGLASNGALTTNYLTKSASSGASLAASVIYDDGTSVGIGTVSPNALLEVSGTAIFGGIVDFNSDLSFAGQASPIIRLGTMSVRFRNSAGDTDRVVFADSGGIQVGVPTGGDPGAGWINAASGYKVNNVAVPTVGSKLSVFAATTSAELAGVISDETGSGALVFATAPTLSTGALVAAGTGAGTATLVGVLNVNITSQATTGTTPETLASFTLPANSLSADGKGVRITAWATTAANANGKAFKILWNGTGGSIAVTMTTTVSGSNIFLLATVIRTGAGAQICQGMGWDEGGNNDGQIVSGSADETGAISILVQGSTPSGAGELTFKGLIVEMLN